MKNFRSNIIILVVVFVLFIVGIFVLRYALSFHKLKVEIQSDIPVLVYKSVGEGKETIANTQTSASFSVKDGKYCAAVTDEKYDTTPVCIDIAGKKGSISIDAQYSTSYLKTLLTDELNVSLSSMISAKYDAIIGNYTLSNGQLLGKSDYYAATLTQIVAPSDRGDVYRVLLQKKNGDWSIVAYPQIVLSKNNYPNIPVSILNKTNTLLGVY